MRVGTKKQRNFDAKKIGMAALVPYMFIVPTLILMVALVAYPLIVGCVTSLFDTNLTNRWDFVGISNYLEIFTNMKFWDQLILTFKFTFFVVVGHFVLGVLFASLLNKEAKIYNVFKVILILPWIFPDVVVALIFSWILNPLYGLLNSFLVDIGAIGKSVSWLGSAETAFGVVVLVCIWKGYPLVMMNVLAGLQSIPADIFDAAKVDGANKLQTLFRITLPSIKPVIITALILDTVWWFKHYTIISLLTDGGPGSVTSIISLEIYEEAFSFFEFGTASAMSVVVFVICIVVSKVYRRVFDNED